MPGRDGGAQVAVLLEQAIARYAAGDVGAALRLFRDAAALGPEDVRARAYVEWMEWRSSAASEFAERDSTAVRRLVQLGSFTDDEDDATPVRSVAAVLATRDEPSQGGEDEPTSVGDADEDEDEITFSGEDGEEGERGERGGTGRTQVFRSPSREAAATVELPTGNVLRTVELPAAEAAPTHELRLADAAPVELTAEPEELPPLPPAPPPVVEMVAEPESDEPEAAAAPPPSLSPSTSHPSLRAQREILEQLTPLRQAVARRDPVAAWIEAERLMSRGLDMAAVPGATELLSRVYRERLEPLGRAALVAQRPERLEPRAAFVVSQADGSLSIEDLLDISPIPRLDALRLLARLFDEGILYAGEHTQL